MTCSGPTYWAGGGRRPTYWCADAACRGGSERATSLPCAPRCLPWSFPATVSALAGFDLLLGTARSSPEWACLAMAVTDTTKSASDNPIVRRILIRMRLHVIDT